MSAAHEFFKKAECFGNFVEVDLKLLIKQTNKKSLVFSEFR